MTDGFEAARSQRNLLERLGEKIPGFRGFQDRELRRDVDRMQREHLAAELGRLKSQVRDRARAHADAGRLGALNGFDRLERQLDGLSQAVRFADYGASGLFDAVKIGEAELQRLYEFDLSMLDDVAELESLIAAVPPPGPEDPAAALDAALQRVRTLGDRWRQRELVIGNVVQAGAGA